MTTEAKRDAIRWAGTVAQILMLAAITWVATAMSDIKTRVAVIESDLARLTVLHEEFNQHARDGGIHQHPDIKRAVTKEIVDERIAAALERVERKLEEMQTNIPPAWFREYVEDLKRRIEALENEKGNG